MKGEFFITKKAILKILAQYGGRRKYEFKEKCTPNKKYEIVFAEKKNPYLQLTMKHAGEKVIVTRTDDSGKVIQRDFFTTEGEWIGGETDVVNR